MAKSPKPQNKQQRRWAVCRAKVKSGAFSAVIDIDSDSGSEPDEGFLGDDASRPGKLRVRKHLLLQLLILVHWYTVLPCTHSCNCPHI